MSLKLDPMQNGGFISRWMRRLIRDVLEEHDRGRFVTIYSNRKPDDRDILYSPGAQWFDQQERKRYALKEITAKWVEIADEK